MLDSIRLLRGVAVGAVVLFHFRAVLPDVYADLASIVSHGGTYGVSLFFVISGFVITMATLENPAPASAFMTRRVFRIFPLATVTTMICYGLKLYFGLGEISSLKDLMASLFFLPLSNEAPPFYGYRVLPVQWTLTYEFIFYTLFYISLTFTRIHHYRVVAVLLMMMVFGLQALYGKWTLSAYESPLIEGSGPIHGLMSLLANPIFLLFIVGILLARFYVLLEESANGQRWLLQRIIPISCGLLVFSVWVNIAVISFAVWSFVMVLICERYIRTAKWVSGLTHLGDISYSVYLVHPIVYLCYEALSHREWGLGTVSCLFPVLILIVASVALSELTYRWVEQPGIRLGKRLASIS